MSVTTESPSPQPATSDPRPAGLICVQCGAALADDQEWCLECGAARRLIHRPPDWRVPVAVIGVVIGLVLAAFLIALIDLSSDANRSAGTAAAPAVTVPASAPPSSTTPTGATTAPSGTTVTITPSGVRIAGWPMALPGWTVALTSRRTKAAAEAAASRIAATGTPVGILNSSEHPSMTPGFWIVFSGRYPTQAAASASAAALIARGESRAKARLVGRPGG